MNAYEKLRKKLDTCAFPCPESESKSELEFLKCCMSPEEAELACVLEEIPADVKTIAQKAGMEVEKVAPMLEEMAGKGVIFRYVNAPEPIYALVAFKPGIQDFQVNWYTPDMARHFENYFQETFSKAFFSTRPSHMRVVPVGKSMPAELNVLTYEEVDKLIDETPAISLARCACRHATEVLGGNSKYPIDDMCIIFSPMAEYYSKYGIGREATKEEAKQSLRKAEEAGLVHNALNVKTGNFFICNCDPESCTILTAINKLKIPTAVAKSNFVVEITADKCVGCSTCVDRCPVAANKLIDSVSVLEKARCIGCGLCIAPCPAEARSLGRRPEEVPTPMGPVELFGAMQQGRKEKEQEKVKAQKKL